MVHHGGSIFAALPPRPSPPSHLQVALLALMLLSGAHMFGIASSYSFVFIEHELGGSKQLLGWALTASALLEVPLFQVAGGRWRRDRPRPSLSLLPACALTSLPASLLTLAPP